MGVRGMEDRFGSVAILIYLLIYIMADKTKFLAAIKTGYTFKGEAYKVGCAVLDGEVVSDAAVLLPLKTMNRHGSVNLCVGAQFAFSSIC